LYVHFHFQSNKHHHSLLHYCLCPRLMLLPSHYICRASGDADVISTQVTKIQSNIQYCSGCIFAFFLVVQHLLVLISCLLFPNTGISAVAATIDVHLHRKTIIRSSKRSNITSVGWKTLLASKRCLAPIFCVIGPSIYW
jgi:hypothetical protein